LANNVKEFKLLSLVYESTGNATILFKTDRPGGTMATRATFNSSSACKIENTNGLRKTFRGPLDGIRGCLYQLKITPDSGVELMLYEGKLELKEIGLYRDGTCGEYFETEELS